MNSYCIGDKVYDGETCRYGEVVSIEQPPFYKHNTPLKYKVKWVVHKDFPVYRTTLEENLDKFEKIVAFEKI